MSPGVNLVKFSTSPLSTLFTLLQIYLYKKFATKLKVLTGMPLAHKIVASIILNAPVSNLFQI